MPRWIAQSLACAALLLVAPARAQHPSGAEPPSPMIARVEPSSGPSTGGTEITITGFCFAPGAVVKLGGVSATAVEIVAPGKLVAVTGPHRPGKVSVSVTNPDGRSGFRGWSYRYVHAGR